MCCLGIRGTFSKILQCFTKTKNKQSDIIRQKDGEENGMICGNWWYELVLPPVAQLSSLMFLSTGTFAQHSEEKKANQPPNLISTQADNV